MDVAKIPVAPPVPSQHMEKSESSSWDSSSTDKKKRKVAVKKARYSTKVSWDDSDE